MLSYATMGETDLERG